MKELRYISDVTTLSLDASNCIGCGMCSIVCPHGVVEMNHKRARIIDRDGCMECGACATNCPTAAIRVTPGVGCALYIIDSWIKGRGKAACGDTACC